MAFSIKQSLNKGIAAHKKGNLEEAEKDYREILKYETMHADANHNLGILAISVGKIEEALPFLKKASEAAPGNSHFWCGYIGALVKLDHFEVAQTVLDLAKTKVTECDKLEKLQAEINACLL